MKLRGYQILVMFVTIQSKPSCLVVIPKNVKSSTDKTLILPVVWVQNLI
jgi:hypothetical protein